MAPRCCKKKPPDVARLFWASGRRRPYVFWEYLGILLFVKTGDLFGSVCVSLCGVAVPVLGFQGVGSFLGVPWSFTFCQNRRPFWLCVH